MRPDVQPAPVPPTAPAPHEPPSRDNAPRENATLSRELGEVLVQFAIALHKHAIYPAGHPMLTSAVDAVWHRLRLLHATRPVLSLGVARRQLIIEGVATDPDNPVLRELAERLHRHHVGAVKLTAGVEARELTALLRLLASDPERGIPGETVGPIGLDPVWRDAWAHARVYPLTYGQLELVERLPDEEGEGAGGGVRAASLWIGLARAALAADEQTEVSADTAPAVVARAIDAGSQEVAYDQVIVGYLLQIATDLRTGNRADNEALRRRVSQLVSAMQPETLRRLLQMGGDGRQRRQFVLDASHALAADVVVSVVEAAGAATGQTVSHSLLRLLAKLAAHAEAGTEDERPRAEGALREQVQRLVADWEIADPNPEAYRAALDGMARAAPELGLPESTDVVEPLRLVAMSLELGAAGPPTWRAVDALLDRGHAAALIELLEQAAPESAAAPAVCAHVATPERLTTLLAREPLDAALLEWMVPRLGTRAAAPLLDALAVAERRATRWKLLTLLERLGAAIAPEVVARLPGAPWYVQRNLLLLLAKLPVHIEGFSPAPYVRHEDPRVRREAVRMLLRVPGGRVQGVRAALADLDAGVVQLGLAAAAEECSTALVPLVASHATDEEAEPHLRALAARVLGGVADPRALEALLQVAAPRRSLMGRPRLAPRSPELIAALAALAARWRGEPRAAEILAAAERSADADVRAAAAGAAR
ncbi:MAG TPA: hypothetical protein VFS05_07510 [Gemmatimonadaceae bacterium]|nr:hypothetical protein [Gemmatimonadaceae bacterium]